MKIFVTALASLFFSAQIMAAPVPAAKAELQSKSGSKAMGTVEFSQAGEGLKIDYKVSGLTPNSNFGFHIHEKGDCSSPDAKSAGSHFHKTADTGGTSKETPGAFAGDLPQLKSDAQGNSQGTVTMTTLSLTQANAVNGLAVMIHGGPDDATKSSPPRIACGVIKTISK